MALDCLATPPPPIRCVAPLPASFLSLWLFVSPACSSRCCLRIRRLHACILYISVSLSALVRLASQLTFDLLASQSPAYRFGPTLRATLPPL